MPLSDSETSFLRQLVGHRGGGLLIIQAEVADGLEPVAELVDERDPRRDIQLRDHLVGDLVQILDQGADAVPWAAMKTLFPARRSGTTDSCQ